MRLRVDTLQLLAHLSAGLKFGSLRAPRKSTGIDKLMLLRRLCLPLWTIVLSLPLLVQAQSESSAIVRSAQVDLPPAKVIEKSLAFPSPVQWRLNPDNRSADISLIGLAWGPAVARELIAKGRERQMNETAEQFSDRTYVIALGFQARMAQPLLDMRTRSGLALIRDTSGNMELPWDLTSAGLARSDYDIHFARGNVTTQYWDFFPVSSDQKEFLFEVHSPAQSVSYFRVILKDKDLRVVGSTPNSQSACLQFDKSFGGSIGADTLVSLQIKRQTKILSGTQQYAKSGKTLWLTGVVDSSGYFMLEERYPQNRVTGILKGRFAADYQTMSGYFSKPDGSRLQPFEFHEVQPTGTKGQVASQQNCEPEESAGEPPTH
jgi:hypothetical protein